MGITLEFGAFTKQSCKKYAKWLPKLMLIDLQVMRLEFLPDFNQK